METFIESFSAGVDAVDSFVWGWALIWLLLGTHFYHDHQDRLHSEEDPHGD